MTQDGSGFLKPQTKRAGYYVDFAHKRRMINLCTDKDSAVSALTALKDIVSDLRAGRSVSDLFTVPPIIQNAVREALDEKANRVREAQPMTEDEVSRLMDAVYGRPLAQYEGQRLKNDWNTLARSGD